ENMANSSQVIQRAVLREQCGHRPLVLHGDNGSAMKGSTIHARLAELGVTPSHSRARVSNDNAYSESLFRTCKYHPTFPVTGFTDLTDARCRRHCKNDPHRKLNIDPCVLTFAASRQQEPQYVVTGSNDGNKNIGPART